MNEPPVKSNRGGRRFWITLVLVFVMGIALGTMIFGRDGGSTGTGVVAGSDPGLGSEEATIWTCSMHPQIKLPNPGKCPICFMDLIPLVGDSGTDSPVQLSMSESSMKLAEVQTTIVGRAYEDMELRTVGKISADERRLRKITAWVPGRLDRLFVDYTGVSVRKGDHLVEIYSPELYSAQAELIEAIKARDELSGSRSDFVRDSADGTVIAVREKLRLLGLKDEQVDEVERRGTPAQHVTIYAPVGGIVVHKAAMEGDYVTTGSPIYTIADLSEVWVMLDVYESDLVWIRFGQKVEFSVEAYPGEKFEGRVAFIDPVVNPGTRTVKVRVNALNPGLRLKPNMFVRVRIRAAVTAEGGVVAPDLAGKWISPMHPEIVKDQPGTCDICGMPLVPASELGFITDSERAEEPIIIPLSAPLITGKRAVVYVKVPNTERPTFEGREITLGPRTTAGYVVIEGLVPGEEVVTRGSFKIDSAMQIQAKPSMMSPEGGAPPPGHDHGGVTGAASGTGQQAPGASEGRDQGADHETSQPPLPDADAQAIRQTLQPVYDAYFALHESLAGDTPEDAARAASLLETAVETAIVKELSKPGAEFWESWSRTALSAIRACKESSVLTTQRTAFADISNSLVQLERLVGHPESDDHVLMFCPMAFDNAGAWWLQRNTTVTNPYYGASMLKCGAIKETFGGHPSH